MGEPCATTRPDECRLVRNLPTDPLGLVLIGELRAGWIRDDGSVRGDEIARDLAPYGVAGVNWRRAVRLVEIAAREALERRERER